MDIKNRLFSNVSQLKYLAFQSLLDKFNTCQVQVVQRILLYENGENISIFLMIGIWTSTNLVGNRSRITHIR